MDISPLMFLMLVSPIILEHSLTLILGKAFVTMSAGICSVCVKVRDISFHLTLSHTQNSLRSSCFI